MKNQFVSTRSVWGEFRDFIIHLRWHYQLGILSGGFLLGGLISPSMHWQTFLIQFLNVHLLLFGGATAYNSYWDKDEGPVGGLKYPPEMTGWMRPVSILMQIAGLILAFKSGILFTTIYALSIILFWLYSTPLFRWKSSPLKSLAAIGISTGTNSALLGYLAAGNVALNSTILIAALGVMCIILSLYPVSQLYQIEDDAKRGDRTFAVTYGFNTVLKFFAIIFTTGIFLVAFSMQLIQFLYGIIFLAAGIGICIWIYYRLRSLSSLKESYKTVMHIKYSASMAFVSFIFLLLLITHTG